MPEHFARLCILPAVLEIKMCPCKSLSPISQIGACEAGFIQYLPSALVYRLSANAKDLIVEPWGGLDVLTALHHRSASVVAVVSNPLLIDAVARFGRGIGVRCILIFWPQDRGQPKILILKLCIHLS